MSKNGQNEAENIILQAIAHSERRGIIRIIGANPNGVTYSSILGETQLNTGHLNYHLRSLEGLIEKSDDRYYHLTPLGIKSLELLNNLRKDIDSDMLPYVEVARRDKDGVIHPFVKGLLYIGIAGIGIVFFASIVLAVVSITSGGLMGVLVAGGMMVFTGVVLWVLIGSLKTVPEFVRRLERKLMKD
jgi:predicted transcriptional regulator